MRHLLSPLDFSVEELDQLLDLANDIEHHPEKYAHKCEGKKLATLFYEPSTRTRLSFEAAMMNLGGNVIGFSNAASSSAAKGESVSDTIRMISCYADICAMRHPKEGAPMVASLKSSIPVINAGDGGHQHPSQTLTDLLTIRSLKGRLHDMTIGLCGDLKFGRTVHSLINALVRYNNIKFVLISPPELRVPSYIRDNVLKNFEFEEVSSLEDAMPKLDILYMTRVQRERFFNEEDYIRMKDCYILDKAKMSLAKEDMIVLHPLPRVNEISVEVDDDPRAAYFRQVQYGVYVRMALILRARAGSLRGRTVHGPVARRHGRGVRPGVFPAQALPRISRRVRLGACEPRRRQAAVRFGPARRLAVRNGERGLLPVGHLRGMARHYGPCRAPGYAHRVVSALHD